jgi:hypothetical protein
MMRLTVESQHRTGHKTGWPDCRWVCASIFFPFFWSDLEKVRVSEFEDSLRAGAEYNASYSGAFCSSRLGCLGVLAGAHHKKETVEDDIGGVCIHRQSSIVRSAGKQLEELT